MVENMRGSFVTVAVSTPNRRLVLQGLAGTALATLPAAGWAEAEYPSRTITVICPFAPGGINDVCARVVAKGLERAFKQTVVTENRPGASTLVAMDHLARSTPDGHMLLTCSDRIVCFPTIGKTTFDIEKDFAPITRLIISPMFLVTRNGLEVKSVTDLIALAKAKPTLTFASTGPGSTTHLTGELFKVRDGREHGARALPRLRTSTDGRNGWSRGCHVCRPRFGHAFHQIGQSARGRGRQPASIAHISGCSDLRRIRPERF